MQRLASGTKTDDNILGREIIQQVMESFPPHESMTVNDMRLLAVVMAHKSLSSYEGKETPQEKRERIEYLYQVINLMQYALRKKTGRVDRAAYVVTLGKVYDRTKVMVSRYAARIKRQ